MKVAYSNKRKKCSNDSVDQITFHYKVEVVNQLVIKNDPERAHDMIVLGKYSKLLLLKSDHSRWSYDFLSLFQDSGHGVAYLRPVKCNLLNVVEIRA